MAIRHIIEIDEELCDGCGDCVSACAEGAIQLIDGTAKLVSDSYCDGLGACIGDCPQGAISIVERDAAEFDEHAVAMHLARRVGRPEPSPTLHLLDSPINGGGGCPGARARALQPAPATEGATDGAAPSQLGHWPIQLHLVPATAPFFRGADLLLAADCVPFAVAGFHRRFLSGHAVAIACPKLDSNQEVYVDKLTTMIDDAQVASIHVVVMEVPCCGGLVRLVEQAVRRASRTVPVRATVIGTDGAIRREVEVQREAV
jgi:NAD-dependent dihydropyrimidine dehydrogenase PreA subunit